MDFAVFCNRLMLTKLRTLIPLQKRIKACLKKVTEVTINIQLRVFELT
jgi:hypothetical protein